MYKINSFLTIGTIGILATSLLHICMTLFVQGKSMQVLCMFLYPVFILFLLYGLIKITKEQKAPEP